MSCPPAHAHTEAEEKKKEEKESEPQITFGFSEISELLLGVVAWAGVGGRKTTE